MVSVWSDVDGPSATGGARVRPRRVDHGAGGGVREGVQGTDVHAHTHTLFFNE